MKRTRAHIPISVRTFFVLLLACLALQSGAGTGLAASSGPAALRDEPLPQLPLVCSTNISLEYCNIQVVLLIDDTGSMRANDPTRMRNQGAKNLVDILAQEYYQPALDAQALDPNVVLPDVRVAVIHFSHCVSDNLDDKCGQDVKYNSGWLSIAQKDELYTAIDWLKTQPIFYRVKQFTHFPEPFQAAVNLFDLLGAAPDAGCARRFVLLLTDGTPENAAGPIGEPGLGEEMGQVKQILTPFLSKPENHVYVTAFKIVPQYWQATEPYWQDMAQSDNVSLETSLDEVASRMEKIAAPNIGVQSYTLSPSPDDPQLYEIVLLPHLQSLRLTYYKLNPASTLSLTDPQGNPVVPDGNAVIRTGSDTSIEVWTLSDPPAGAYQIRTSIKGGIVTAIPLYAVSVQLESPTLAQPLVKFADGEVRFKLLDSMNQPVLPTDNPTYNFDLQASLTTESGESTPLSLTLASGSYRADWIPRTDERQVLHIRLELTDVDHNSAWRCEGDGGELLVDPVTITADPPDECTPVNTAVVVPLQLEDARTGGHAGTSLPVQWEVSSVTIPRGRPVEGSVGVVDVKAGSYELRLVPAIAEDIGSHVTASVVLHDGAVQIYDEEFTSTVCPIPVPPAPPPPAAKCGPDWNCLLWMLILLVIFVLTWPFVRRRGEDERFPFWAALAVLLILLLLLAWLLWFCNFPSWPLWILLLILLAILLLWALIWLTCHFANPLWGVIGILDEDDQALWSAPLADPDQSNGRGCYDWEFDRPVGGVRHLRIRSWNQRQHWLGLKVTLRRGGKSFKRTLDDWQDCELGDGIRIVWQEIDFEWTTVKPFKRGKTGKARKRV